MAISFILNDEAVNDQTAGLQTDDGGDGFTDTDVTYGSLFALYGTYLETTLGLSNTFPTNVGVATKTNSVTVNASAGAQLTDITFTDSAGGALTGDPATDDSGLDTVDGKSIILVAGPDGSGVDGDNVVIGKYDSDGNGDLDATAFVIIKEEVLNAGATSAQVTFHVITYVPIAHGDPNDPDDAVNLGNSLKLSASETVTFNFGGTPSGNHLFTMVTAGGIGLVATPETEVIKLHISQGGGPTTLGVFNQMIDPGEAMVFTFVTNPDPTVTVPNLSQGEADDETNILFDGVHTTTGGSVVISQTQGNDPAGMRLTALNTQGDGSATEPSGDGFINGYGNDPIAAISEVRIFDDTGTLLLTATGDVTDPVNGITVDFLATGEVEVRGLEDDYKVEYDAASHERLKVTGLEGKFDIGGIGIESAASESTFVGQQIVIEDDGPATSANATVLLDDDALAGGNPGGTGDDADAANTSGTLGHAFGTDGAGSIAFLTTGAPAGFTYELSDSDLLIKQGATTVVTVTLNTATGAYSVTQNAPILHAAGNAENNQAFTLNYQVTDGDGDTATGTLGINVDDDTPTTSANATAQLDDDALAGGNPGGVGDDVDAANLSGTLGHSFGADGGSIAFLTTGAPAGFTYELSGSSLLIKQGATTVVTVSLNTATGAYSVTQNAPILHAAGLDENNQAFTLNYQVTDGDGDTANGTLGINVDDDTPTTSANATVLLDDDALAGGNPGGTGDDADAANTSGTLGHSFGADGGSIAFLTSGAPAGFTYELSGSSLLIKQGGTIVVTVTLNTATGAYSVTQNAPILHAAGLDENNQAFTLNYQVTDGDGDTANGTLGINVDDDTPIIGPISDGFVDFAAGDSDTKSLNGSVGADGPATYSITSFPATVTIFDGTPAELTLLSDISPDSTVVNYFQDNDGSGTRTAGDTDFFRLTLAGGNYTFDVLQDPPPATLEFDFDELPSGANLFGVVGTTSTEPAIIVIGENISLKADNTYDNKSDTVHTSQGGEGATIGLNNQLLDNIGEGIYFTYVDDPVQDFLSGAPGGLTATEADDADNIQYTGGTLEVGTASFTVSQMQGNDLAAVTINAYDILDAPQGVDFVNSLGSGIARPIDDVRVFDETGTLIETFDGSVDDPNVTIKIDGGVATVGGLDAGYTVEWDTIGLHDRVLIQNAGGQFDIGRFVIEQPQPTPDEKLDFAVQIADADGDTATTTFSVGIDGTGVFDDGVITV